MELDELFRKEVYRTNFNEAITNARHRSITQIDEFLKQLELVSIKTRAVTDAYLRARQEKLAEAKNK